MKENYDNCLNATLVHEGGWSNHPKDPGGATMRGVTQRTYDGWRQRNNLPKRSVRFIETSELKDIYRKQYWDITKCDELPAGIDFLLFDGNVNSGPDRSVRWLQDALGVKVDGHIGEATLSAAREYPDHDELCAAILVRRLAFMRGLKTWKTFGKGWSARVAGAKVTAQAWASGNVAPEMRYISGAHAKAELKDVNAPPAAMAPLADATMATGSVTAAIASATQQLEPLKASSPSVMNIFIALTIAGICVGALGGAIRWYRNQRAAEAQAVIDGAQAVDIEMLSDLEVPYAA